MGLEFITFRNQNNTATATKTVWEDPVYENSNNINNIRVLIKEELGHIIDERMIKLFTKYDEEQTRRDIAMNHQISEIMAKLLVLEKRISSNDEINSKKAIISPLRTSISDIAINKQICDLVAKIATLEETISAIREINSNSDTIIPTITLENRTTTEDAYALSLAENNVLCHNITETNSKNISTGNFSKLQKKLCVLSNDKNHVSLDIVETKFVNNWKYCNYRKTNTDIKTLLKDLHLKTQDFTLDDYCIIFLGEIDFLTTQNYLEIIYSIRNELLKTVHTNVIICLPTYKKDSFLFNSRVENFCNMLILDIETHKYAYWLDSNLDLTDNMYSRVTGKVNEMGIRNVFSNLSVFIQEIERNSKTVSQHKQISKDSECNAFPSKPNEYSSTLTNDFFRV